MVFPERCTGCRICELVCSMEKEGRFNPRRARIHILSIYPEPGVDMPIVCLQCEDPLCADICGRDAIRRDERTGAVIIDRWDCNGCGKCVPHCPHNAITFYEGDKIPLLCDLCGGDPACVKYCPTQAIKYAFIEEVQRERRAEVMRRLERIPPIARVV